MPTHATPEATPRPRLAALLAVAVAIGSCTLVLFAVLRNAWVSEDGFITLRYVDNIVHGFGAVFNLGEHVQGYTHPLWFLLLIPAYALVRDPLFAPIGCGLLLTALTLIALTRALFRTARSPLIAATLVAMVSAVLLSSNPWRSFQTGGLENPLSHLLLVLVVIEIMTRGIARPARLVLGLGLLCLCRPDFALLAAPLGLLIASRVRSWRTFGTLALAATPCLGWLLFAWLYYGDIIPNTAYAKVGIFPDEPSAIRLGAIYLRDWMTFDSLAALATGLSLCFALVRVRRLPVQACILGLLLHGLWIVWVGGDFMRGRFLTPLFTASVVLGALVLADQSRTAPAAGKRSLARAAVGLLLGLAAAAGIGAAAQNRFLAAYGSLGIVDERAYYPGYSLDYYRRHHHVQCASMNLGFAHSLRAYAERFGHVTLHLRNPGTMGFLCGPQVTIIDTLGLTDAYIAHLPRTYLVKRMPRVGHPDKFLPVAYLAARGDVSIIKHWPAAIAALDPTLSARARAYGNSDAVYDPFSDCLRPWSGGSPHPALPNAAP